MPQMKTLNGYEVYDAVSRGCLTPVISTGDLNDEGYCENYIATVEGITSLENGISFTMIPHAKNLFAPKLNVNGLGEKQIRQRLSTNTAASTTISEGFILNDYPVRLTFDSAFPPNEGCWIIDIIRVDYNSIYGAAPVQIVTWDSND